MKRVIACFILIFGFVGNVLLAGVQTEFEKTVERLENDGYKVERIAEENDMVHGRKITLKVYSDYVLTEEIEFVKEKRSGGVRYEYDQEGVLRKITGYIYTDDREIKSFCKIYDARGNLIEHEKYEDGRVWKTDHYRYDEKDRLISHFDSMGEGRSQYNYFSERFIYDNENILREEKYVNGDMYSMLVYKYDQHGKLIETNEYYEGKLKETKLYR